MRSDGGSPPARAGAGVSILGLRPLRPLCGYGRWHMRSPWGRGEGRYLLSAQNQRPRATRAREKACAGGRSFWGMRGGMNESMVKVSFSEEWG